MTITIFGASGRVGQLVVTLALAAGHEVVAVTHNNDPFQEQLKLRVVSGDINDLEFVKNSLKGSTAIISTLGSWHTKTKDVVSAGTANIIQAAQATGIKRVITLTGTAALMSDDKPSLMDKLSHSFLKLIAPKILNDGEAHLRLLEASTLDWTCIRSPAMSNSHSAAYILKTKLAPITAKCSRAAVAQSLLDQLSTDAYFSAAPVIYQA